MIQVSTHTEDRVEAMFDAILANPKDFPDWWFEPDEEDQSNEEDAPEAVSASLVSSVSVLDRIVGTDRATVTIPEAAVVLGVSESAARRAAHRGQLPTIRVNRRVLVPAIAFRRLLGDL